jgi:hypothetical protein
MEEDIKKVFINNENRATFVCPACNKATTADVGDQKDAETAVKIQHKCACGHSHTVLLERRQFYRKDVDIPGVYIVDGLKKTMTVKDISRHGLKFYSESDEQGVKVGDGLYLEFRLDNGENLLIKKEGIVKKASAQGVRVEFYPQSPDSDIEQSYDKAIVSYIFSEVGN